MRTPWKIALVSALALTALLGLSPVSATHTGTVGAATTVSDNGVNLAVDEYVGYTFTLSGGESIVYAIQVVTGDNIDVFFFGASGLATYRAEPVDASQAISSFTNDNQIGGTFSAATGAITVVIDNVNGTGVAPTGPVSVQVGITTSGGAPPSTDLFTGIIAAGILLCAGVIVLIVVVIVVIIWAITRGSRPPMPPPQPPYMPPPQQPWPPQPPQGGYPPEQYPPQNP